MDKHIPSWSEYFTDSETGFDKYLFLLQKVLFFPQWYLFGNQRAVRQPRLAFDSGIKILSLGRLMCYVLNIFKYLSRCLCHVVAVCYYVMHMYVCYYVAPASVSTFWDTGRDKAQVTTRLTGNYRLLCPQIRGVGTRCSTGCCWIALSSRWSCRMTKVTTLTSHHWRILTWRTLSGCESCVFLWLENEYMEQITLLRDRTMENSVCVPV